MAIHYFYRALQALLAPPAQSVSRGGMTEEEQETDGRDEDKEQEPKPSGKSGQSQAQVDKPEGRESPSDTPVAAPVQRDDHQRVEPLQPSVVVAAKTMDDGPVGNSSSSDEGKPSSPRASSDATGTEAPVEDNGEAAPLEIVDSSPDVGVQPGVVPTDDAFEGKSDNSASVVVPAEVEEARVSSPGLPESVPGSVVEGEVETALTTISSPQKDKGVECSKEELSDSGFAPPASGSGSGTRGAVEPEVATSDVQTATTTAMPVAVRISTSDVVFVGTGDNVPSSTAVAAASSGTQVTKSTAELSCKDGAVPVAVPDGVSAVKEAEESALKTAEDALATAAASAASAAEVAIKAASTPSVWVGKGRNVPGAGDMNNYLMQFRQRVFWKATHWNDR